MKNCSELNLNGVIHFCLSLDCQLVWDVSYVEAAAEFSLRNQGLESEVLTETPEEPQPKVDSI